MVGLTGRRARANGLLLSASAIWGFTFVAQRVGADHVGPFSFNAVRFVLGTLVVVGLARWLAVRRAVPRVELRRAWARAVVPGLLAGLALAAAMNLQQAAMSSVPAGNAAFITGLYMAVVPMIVALRGHRSSAPTLLGVAVAVIGLYLIAVTDTFRIGTGELLLVVSTLAWAVQILLVDHFGPGLSSLRFAAVQFITCAAVSGIGAALFEPAPFTGLDQAVVPVLYGGVLSVGVAFTLQVIGQRDALATHAALIMSMESVFGAIGGAVLLGEDMGLRGYTGAALMISGIVISQLGQAAEPKDVRAAEPVH